MTEDEAFPLPEVAQRLNGANITWAVFAGTAAFAYGASRSPTDVDILVPAAEGDHVASLFPEASRHKHGSIQALQLPGCDIVAGLGNMDLDDPMAARLTRYEFAGVIVPVIPAEDNILLKGLMGRGPEEGKHDWDDVEAMMAHVAVLDWEYLRWRASLCGPPERVLPVMERLDALWQRINKSR